MSKAEERGMLVYRLSFLRHPLRRSTRSDSQRRYDLDSRLSMQTTGVDAILGLSKTVPEKLETSLASFDFASQEKLVRRMRHSFQTPLRSRVGVH